MVVAGKTNNSQSTLFLHPKRREKRFYSQMEVAWLATISACKDHREKYVYASIRREELWIRAAAKRWLRSRGNWGLSRSSNGTRDVIALTTTKLHLRSRKVTFSLRAVRSWRATWAKKILTVHLGKNKAQILGQSVISSAPSAGLWAPRPRIFND